MYWTSLCLQLLRVKSVFERKIFFYKRLSSSNSTKMPLGSTFYYVSLLRSINSGDVGPPLPPGEGGGGRGGGPPTSLLFIDLSKHT